MQVMQTTMRRGYVGLKYMYGLTNKRTAS